MIAGLPAYTQHPNKHQPPQNHWTHRPAGRSRLQNLIILTRTSSSPDPFHLRSVTAELYLHPHCAATIQTYMMVATESHAQRRILSPSLDFQIPRSVPAFTCKMKIRSIFNSVARHNNTYSLFFPHTFTSQPPPTSTPTTPSDDLIDPF